MKFKATDTINLRSGPSITSPTVGAKIQAGTILESDQYAWKAVTLPDGRKGFSAAMYLEAVPEAVIKWYTPIRYDKFKITQKFFQPDAVTYPKTGHHPGADYGTQGENNVPLFFCSDGEVIENGIHPQFGNYFFFYIPNVDRTFVYFHLRDPAPAKKKYTGGTVCGIAGTTGLSFGIHLHLECMKGRKTSADRTLLYTSKAALLAAAEDADAFIRGRL